MKKQEFTGYTIRRDFDLAGLCEYGFKKIDARTTNPKWQRTFNVKWGPILGIWDIKLFVSEKDRNLFIIYEPDSDRDSLNTTLAAMKKAGILEGEDLI